MPLPTPAWLFDVYPHDRLSSLVVWVRHGFRTTKRLVPYRPDLCLRAEAEPLATAERLLADDDRVEAVWRTEQRLWLRSDPEPVLKVRPRRLQDLHAVATDLRRATASKGFLFFDVDDRPESRWTHANGLFHMCRLHVGPDGPELRLAEGEGRYSLDHPDPALRTVRLAVEAGGRDLDAPLVAVRLGDDRIVCPRPGDPDAERAVLRELGRRLRQTDPDVLVTHRGDAFDVPFLLRRIRDLGLRHEVWLGRDPDPSPDRPDQQGKSLHTYGRWLYKTPAYYLRGRWHIDLSKKPLDSVDDREDLWGILYMTRAANRRAQDINRNGPGFALQQMQIDHARDLGVALPWKRNLAEDWKDAATLCAVDRGGQIMVPTPGIVADVAACDFSGYYPSLIVEHNLSSDTINCTCCPDGPVIPELGYHVCSKQGHQSWVLAQLMGHKHWAKAVLRRARSPPVTSSA